MIGYQLTIAPSYSGEKGKTIALSPSWPEKLAVQIARRLRTTLHG